MKWLSLGLLLLLPVAAGCTDATLVGAELDDEAPAAEMNTLAAKANPNACWGQATRVFAQTDEMGEHASQQPTPRDGLRNLARYLYNEGLIAEDTMQALGQFVADALGLSIEACME